MTTPLLEVRGLTKRFGGVTAVNDLDLDVLPHETLALLGPNGAGKTTAFSLIAGALRPDAGSMTFDGVSLVGRPPHAICQLGIARTYQLVRPLAGLTVEENVIIGALNRTARVTTARDRAREMLDLLGISGLADRLASSLAVAERKRLEVARALATGPRLLLLDEVMSGQTERETAAMMESIARVRQQGVAILLIEHVMTVVVTLADRVVILVNGTQLTAGRPDDVMRDPRVVETFLGA